MSTVTGVVLAAGAGTRLRPLTEQLPKALCPVDNRALLDRAIDHLRPVVGELAVNAHHHANQVAAHIADDVHLSVEQPVALGTAGALAHLREWIDGRDVLVVNADSYLADASPSGSGASADTGRSSVLEPLLADWDGQHCRLLVLPDDDAPDFVVDEQRVRYVGVCLLPWRMVAPLEPTPSGLYEVLWKFEEAAGRLDFVGFGGTAIDCGTPRDYLAANLHASQGESVIGDRAVINGTVERCVVWPDAHVERDEHLVDCIRAGTRAEPITVDAS